MNEIEINDPCLLFALKREASSFLKEFRPQQSFPAAPCRARFCGPEWLTILVVEAGVGRQAVQNALRWLLSKPKVGNVCYRPKVVISAGFSGALCDDLAVGDIILASEVIDRTNRRLAISWPGDLPPDWSIPLRRGRILCSDRFIGQPDEKRRLGQDFQALAVDMESAAAADLCLRHRIPFGCVRVISDDIRTVLSPHLFRLFDKPRVTPFGLAAAACRSPRVVVELWRLAKQTRLAADRLARVLGDLLTLTLTWAQTI
ncbi:MAG: hypothetical protein KatS3mg105_3415 [Gemmatales bacterium]|nr:MAG: hypothetical protein KatS3mg105_3415 [Gemmatales bacterium]